MKLRWIAVGALTLLSGCAAIGGKTPTRACADSRVFCLAGKSCARDAWGCEFCYCERAI